MVRAAGNVSLRTRKGSNEMRHAGTMIVVLTVAGMVCGCGSPEMTNTGRTGIERLVVSSAADKAVDLMDLKALAGKKVFLDTTQFEGTEKAYAIAEIRDHLGAAGALLVSDRDKADAIVEARAGALETDNSTSLIGIPAIPIPIPGAATLTTPEIALFKKVKQVGTAKIALNVLAPDGKQLMTTGHKHGSSYFTRWTILFWFNFDHSDIPEAKATKY